jgi:translation initiation factor 4A
MNSTEITSWNDINMKEDLLRGIYSYGFESPSPIQKRAILPIVQGRDVIAQAQSGTGKTGAFTISSIQCIDENVNEIQVLILAPTRELAIQIHKVVTSLGTFINKFKSKLMIGGVPTSEDMVDNTQVPQILVGTPGRVYDMIRRKKINVKSLRLIILDEADEMLSAGFKEQVYNIFQFLGNDVRVALFSATLPPDIQVLTEKFMRDPVKILVKTESITLEGILQYYVAIEDDTQKYRALKDLFHRLTLSQCIIYCNSIKRVMSLGEALSIDGFPVSCIHSGMEKDERMKAYTDFTSGASRVLISSNVTARGIDVQQVSTVVNFDIPKDIHTYIHRIGRSGRWGRKGMGINFVTSRDIRKMREIEQYYNTQIVELPAQFATM